MVVAQIDRTNGLKNSLPKRQVIANRIESSVWDTVYLRLFGILHHYNSIEYAEYRHKKNPLMQSDELVLLYKR